MIDRASIFADKDVVQWIKANTVPVAIDQAYERRQQDTEGEFYRKIIKPSPRGNPKGTTQGFFLASASGEFLGYNNNRTPDKLLAMLKAAVKRQPQGAVAPIKVKKVDARYSPKPPEGGLVIRVRSKVLSGYAPTTDKWKKMVRQAVSRDNLWLSKAEHQALLNGEVLGSLAQRMARFHLVDSTRGEPSMWKKAEVKSIKLELVEGKFIGGAELVSSDAKRSYHCQIRGSLVIKSGKIAAMQMVALGAFSGEGPYTKGAPKGKFPLVVTFTLADGSDMADSIPPQGSRGLVKGYISE